MFVSGLLTALGIGLVLVKLPKWIALRLLGRHVLIDASISLCLAWALANTYSGLIAATVGGICVSLTTAAMRGVWGYVRADIYYPGWIRIDPAELKRPKPFSVRSSK